MENVFKEPQGVYNKNRDFTSLICWQDARMVKLFIYKLVFLYSFNTNPLLPPYSYTPIPLYLYTLIPPITEGHPYGYHFKNLSSKPENKN